MPTARELLEQADALMRRNRSRDVEPDIPELTDEVVIAANSLALRDPGLDLRLAAARPGVPEDVPELSDVVGEIEELSIEPLPDDGGEDSRWLEANLGEASVTGPAPDSIVVVPPAALLAARDAATDSANAAVTESATEATEAPAVPPAVDEATVAASSPPPALPDAVPPSTSGAGDETGARDEPVLPAGSPFETDAELDAMLEEAPNESAYEQESPRMEPSPAFSATDAAGAAVSEPDAQAADEESLDIGEPVSEPDTVRAAGEESLDIGEPVSGPDTVRADEESLDIGEPASEPDTARAADEESLDIGEPASEPDAAGAADAESHIGEAASEPETARAAGARSLDMDDPARWSALAEDIRMQVLQRIDIYTDTGLAGELATRLQPIVDRAGADLIATINRQVGQLLRAYVAEAIEREIEKWREGSP